MFIESITTEHATVTLLFQCLLLFILIYYFPQISGSQFWKSNRKIVAVKSAQYTQAKQTSLGKRNKKWKPNELLSHLEDIVEAAAAANVKSSPTSVNVPTSEVLKENFKCTVCLNTSELPAACCPCCSNVIGCIPCIEQWLGTQHSPTCPLCRVNERYQVIPYVAKMAKLLGNKQDKTVQARALSVVGTSANTGSSDVVSTGASTSVTSNVASTTLASNDQHRHPVSSVSKSVGLLCGSSWFESRSQQHSGS